MTERSGRGRSSGVTAWRRMPQWARTVWAALLLASVACWVLVAVTDWRWTHVVAPLCTVAAGITMLATINPEPSAEA